MTRRLLEREFAPLGHATRSGVVFDEHVALALVRRAEEAGIAVVAVDPLRPGELEAHERLAGRWLDPLERRSSWRQARLFVESWSSRGLYFDVRLESPWATWFARFRQSMSHGPAG